MIHDEHKIDSLIHDLESSMANLEEVSKQLTIADLGVTFGTTSMTSATLVRTGDKRTANAPKTIIAPTMSRKHGTESPDEAVNDDSTMKISKATQINDDSIGAIGQIGNGQNISMNIYEAQQENKNKSVAVIGVMSEAVAKTRSES